MSSLVNELQQAALDEKSSVSSLLRKALLVASKLAVPDFEAWVRNELEGYRDEPVPNYRVVRGTPKVFNPMRGYQALTVDDPELAAMLSTMHLGQSVDTLEDSRKTSPGGTWSAHYGPRDADLMKAMEYPMKPSLHLADSTRRGILGRVRTIVLEWALKLEKQGVVGSGMTFTEKERQKAASIQVETLIQGVTGSQIQVHSPGAHQHQAISAGQVTDIKALVGLVSSALSSGP